MQQLTSLFGGPQASVRPPSGTTTVLSAEHFSSDVSTLRFPAKIDLSDINFKLRNIDLLAKVKEGAPREIDLSKNELISVAVLNRFLQLRSINASGNSIAIGAGVVLRLPKLVELDLSENRLVAVPPLTELPSLQVLRLQRNQICRSFGELKVGRRRMRCVEAMSDVRSLASKHT